MKPRKLGIGLSVLVALLALFLGAGTLFQPKSASADGTVNYTGQGTTNGELTTVQCSGDTANIGDILWVLTASGATSATITINGTTYNMVKKANGAFQYVSNGQNLATVTAYAKYKGTAKGSVQLVISHGCPKVVLDVTKTADTSFDRTYDWTIDKVVDGDDHLVIGKDEDSVTAKYNVTVDVSDPIDSNYAVSGTITIYNPGPSKAVITAVNDSLGATDCGAATLPYTLAVSGTLTCTYDVGVGSGDSGTNTATVTVQYGGGPFTGNANYSFGDPTNVYDDCVDVADTTYVEDLGTVCVGEAPKTFPYQHTFTRDDLDGKCGEENSKDFPNTATAVENSSLTPRTDDATVNVVAECVEEATGFWCSPGFWAQNQGSLAGTDYDPAPYLGDPVPGFDQYTVGYALANPDDVGGEAFNAAANYLATIFFGVDAGTQESGDNCPIDAHGVLKD